MWQEWLKGFIGGSLIVVFCAFVYGQYRFQTEQKIFTIGFVDGAWVDVPKAKTK